MASNTRACSSMVSRRAPGAQLPARMRSTVASIRVSLSSISSQASNRARSSAGRSLAVRLPNCSSSSTTSTTASRNDSSSSRASTAGRSGTASRVRRRVDNQGPADGDPGRGRKSLQEPVRQVVRLLQARQLAAGPRVDDGAGQLGGQGHQQGYLVVLEAPRLALAQHQHAQHLAILDDGCAEKAAEAVLAGLMGKQVTRVTGCIVQIDGLRPLADQADQAAVQG